MTLAAQMRRLGKHSAVYGLGGIVSRLIAVFLLPVSRGTSAPKISARSASSSRSRPSS